MRTLSWIALAGAAALGLYAYVGYLLILRMWSLFRRRPLPLPRPPCELAEWPAITITIPVHNEEAFIGATLERILALDYPAGRRQILVISDASSDGTDEIVARFADRGVELLRLPQRRGKTAAENAARPYLRGEIVVNTDAFVRIDPAAVKPLIASFADPEVGLASGRDVSVASLTRDANLGESAYVGYEMRVRGLETRVFGIVGASGCLYAVRAPLQMEWLPEALSRDFAAPLIAREHGYRAVSVPEAICCVPRGDSLRREYRRKVRTLTRGIATLLHKRRLLNPFRYGVFAWMLCSHKACRWLLPWALLWACLGLGNLAVGERWPRWVLLGFAVAGILAAVAWFWPRRRPVPRWLAIPGYVVAGNLACLHAWARVLAGRLTPVWEPTRRSEAGR